MIDCECQQKLSAKYFSWFYGTLARERSHKQIGLIVRSLTTRMSEVRVFAAFSLVTNSPPPSGGFCHQLG